MNNNKVGEIFSVDIIICTIFAIGLLFGILIGNGITQGEDKRMVCGELYTTTKGYFQCVNEHDLSKVYSAIKRIY